MADASPSVLDDPRWHAFNQTGFQCSCGERHVGLFPLHMQVPMGWPGEPSYEPNSAIRMDGNFLSYDFSVLEGKYFAMRMRLPISMQGSGPIVFMYSVWGAMNRPDFEAFVKATLDKTMNGKVHAPGRLANNISGYTSSANLMGTAFQQDDGGYPLLLLHGQQDANDPNHLLLHEQRHGISLDRALELFAAYGHDMRSAAGT